MKENDIIKTELHLDPDVQKKLVEDVSNDIIPHNLNKPNRSSVEGVKEYYQPLKWNDDHYDWLVVLIKEKIESVLGKPVHPGKYWLNRQSDDAFVAAHAHELIDWVSIYYFEAPKGSGPLNFPELNESIYPYNGLLVIHRGNLVHEVFKNSDPNIVRYNFVTNWAEMKTDG